MKTRRSYWTKRIKISLSDSLILSQFFRVQRGRAVDFSIVLMARIDKRWRYIKRCDSTKKHGNVPHCHIYKLNGKFHIENIGKKSDNLGVLARAIIDDINDNYETILENFRYSN